MFCTGNYRYHQKSFPRCWKLSNHKKGRLANLPTRTFSVDFKKDRFSEGVDSFKRIFQIVSSLLSIWRKKKNVNAIYLTISESFAGNIKDLVIYLLCFKYISRMYIHLHGGSIKKLLWNRHRILFSINKILIKRFAGVIVSGQSHLSIFDGMIHRKRLHVVQNFAQDYLFLTDENIRDKFSITKPLSIFLLATSWRRKDTMS